MTEGIISDTDNAYDQIRNRIFDGRLAPGQKISYRGLSGELGLGHMPVRTAIQLLAAEGLVEVVTKSGTYISSPTSQDLREIFEVRLALESTAAYLAARSGVTDGLARAAEQLQQIVGQTSSDIMIEQRIGWVFHQEMFEAAHNDRLFTAYKVLRAQTLALNELPREDAETVRRGTLEHLNIYAAIKDKDPESARRHMWNHIVDGTSARIKLIRAKHESES
ncbi:GntR family transcriptional regulator [Burkholderia alba]|uniref:GntR family transcriptional regulator n=1 Tax=Burkholderia alba TaxID=2683677 RepID=UPI002B056EAF|nr:GntR family transcriptional regulator [Burkholderia alba]